MKKEEHREDQPKKPGRGKAIGRRNLTEVTADFFEVPTGAVGGFPIFEIRGKREIEVEGCDGILEYRDDIVVLSAGGERFTVRGDSLELSDFRSGVLLVRGNIKSAAFGCDYPEGGGADA